MHLIAELEWYRLITRLRHAPVRALALWVAILLVRKAVGG
jgi:hypothetical protein